MMQVTVPPNVVAGQAIAINTAAGQLLQVVVPANLKAGDVFLVSAGAPPATAMVPAATSTPGEAQASTAFAKLGPVGSRVCIELPRPGTRAQVTKTGSNSIEGFMPLTSDGRQVATLMFKSAQKSRQLSASIVLPSNEVIATFERGDPASGGLLSSLRQDFSAAAPAPPIAIGLLGQPYGFFSALGVGDVKGTMGGILDGTELRYADSRLVASTAEVGVGTCLFLCHTCGYPGGYKFTPPTKSSLGEREAPLPVFLGSGLSTAVAVIHVVLPRTRSYFSVREVLCELGNGLGYREKLDVLLMGAAMAAITATERQHQPGGM